MKDKNFKLLKIMCHRGKTQCRFWKEAGLSSESRLSRILNNHVIATDEEVLALCVALNCDAAAIGLVWRGTTNECPI